MMMRNNNYDCTSTSNRSEIEYKNQCWYKNNNKNDQQHNNNYRKDKQTNADDDLTELVLVLAIPMLRTETDCDTVQSSLSSSSSSSLIRHDSDCCSDCYYHNHNHHHCDDCDNCTTLYRCRRRRQVQKQRHRQYYSSSVVVSFIITAIGFVFVFVNNKYVNNTNCNCVVTALFNPKSILSSRSQLHTNRNRRSQHIQSDALDKSMSMSKSKSTSTIQQSSSTVSNRIITTPVSSSSTTSTSLSSMSSPTASSNTSNHEHEHENELDVNEDIEQQRQQQLDKEFDFDIEPILQQQQQQQQEKATIADSLSISISTTTETDIETEFQTPNVVQSSSSPESTSSSSSVLLISTPIVIVLSAVSLLSVATVLAIIGIIPGTGEGIRYTTTEIQQDVLMTSITAILGYIFVKINTTLVKFNIVQPRDARKIIHTFSAPLFILLWPFFTNTIGSRIFAAIVPTVNTIRLYLAAQQQQITTTTTSTSTSTNSMTTSTTTTTTTTTKTSTMASGINTSDEINLTKQNQEPEQEQDTTTSSSNSSSNNNNNNNDELAVAISRSGNVQEALGGPFIYVLMMIGSVLLFWKTSPVAIIALSCMAAGDGVADLFGRRYGQYTPKWTIVDSTTKKTIAGTVAFFIASTITSFLLLLWMNYFHCIQWSDTFLLIPTVSSTSSSTVASVAATINAAAVTVDWISVFIRVVLISFITSLLEVLPARGFDDNYTVPISAAILASLLF